MFDAVNLIVFERMKGFDVNKISPIFLGYYTIILLNVKWKDVLFFLEDVEISILF